MSDLLLAKATEIVLVAAAAQDCDAKNLSIKVGRTLDHFLKITATSVKSIAHFFYSLLMLGFLSQSASAIADKDLDGMSDVWETAYGFSTTGNTNPVQSPEADPDGDGATNLQESIAGTNPLSVHGPLGTHRATISKSTQASTSFDLQWQQLVGKQYSVFQSNNLIANSWTPAASPFVGTSTQQSVPITLTPSATKAFFRVAVSDIDPDGDTLSSHEESQIGTNPSNSDTDQDEIQDGYEYRYGGIFGLNAGDDLDSDSLNNLAEFQSNTDPNDADSDNDQTYDATEVEQDTLPNSASDQGSVHDGKIKIRIGTGTFLGLSYPTPAYPTYPINIYKRDLATGAETLLHSVPTVNSFTAQNIDLPNDGSSYSLQVQLPILGTGIFDQPFRDFSWICQCLTRVGSAPVVIIDRFNTLTNAFGTSGRLLSTPTQLYNPGYRDFRALIIPVGVNYITRDTQTGITRRSNALVEGSDAMPEVKITSASAVINATGQLAITVSGKARDPMSEVLADGTGATQSLGLYLNGELIETLTNLTPQAGIAPVRSPWLRRDSTVAFSKTVLIDDAAVGMHNIRLFSNNNALGKKGFDGITVLVEKQSHATVAITNPPALSFTLPTAFTSGVDSITVTSGSVSSSLTEDPSTPTGGRFIGTLAIDGTIRDIGVEIPADISPSPTIQDRFFANISWRDGLRNFRISGSWLETSLSSLTFDAVPASLENKVNGTGNLMVSHIHHDPDLVIRQLSPTALRLEVPDNFDFFGPSGLLTADLNGTAAAFHEQPAALPYGPPTGKKWFYYGTAAEPQIFTFNDALNGTAQSPSAIASAGKLDLTVKLRTNAAIAFKDTSVLRKLAEFKALKNPPTAMSQLSGSTKFDAQSSISATLPTYTMEEVRFWFDFMFDDAGKNLLESYENGNNTGDFGLVISIQTFWGWDRDTYDLEFLSPYYQKIGGSEPKEPQLFLNRRNLATPIDAATAIFHALQEIRNTDNLFLRSGLETNWSTILDAYLNSATPDPDIEQALRQARLSPIKSTLTASKSAFELGFSFIPGGDLVVTVNDVDQSLVEGNIKGAAVAAGLALVPEIVERSVKYCKRKAINVTLNFGPTGNLSLTPDLLKEIQDAGILSKAKSHSDKMLAIKGMYERGVLTSEQIGLLYDTGYLYIKAGTSRGLLAKNLLEAGFTRTPPGAQAHHWLPIAQKNSELEKEFITRGVDPNVAVHGEFMELEKHKIIHGKGTTGWIDGDTMVHQWREFFNDSPDATPAQIYVFRDQLKALCVGDITSADLINWPKPK